MSVLDPASLDLDNMVLVQLPSGAVLPVHADEVEYFTERVEAYPAQNHFPNISDKQDLDRMMTLELFVYRWSIWMSRGGRDYWDDPHDPDVLQRQIKEYSSELRQLKKLLGIDKLARDKQKGEDSVSAFISNLLVRAREFGIMREKQLDKALELFKQMDALVTLYRNCDETERRENHVTLEDLVDWIETVAIPEFNQVDEYFRHNQQRTWIRSQ